MLVILGVPLFVACKKLKQIKQTSTASERITCLVDVKQDVVKLIGELWTIKTATSFAKSVDAFSASSAAVLKSISSSIDELVQHSAAAYKKCNDTCSAALVEEPLKSWLVCEAITEQVSEQMRSASDCQPFVNFMKSYVDSKTCMDSLAQIRKLAQLAEDEGIAAERVPFRKAFDTVKVLQALTKEPAAGQAKDTLAAAVWQDLGSRICFLKPGIKQALQNALPQSMQDGLA